MIANGKALHDFIDSILKKESFLKKKDTWYLSSEECICFFTLKKSPFGGLYEDLMGCFLKELHTPSNGFPAFNKNDLKFCIDNFVDKELVRRVFDLENNEFKEQQREFYINEFFELHILPFLKDVSTKDGIKEAINKYEDLIYYVKGRAREILSI